MNFLEVPSYFCFQVNQTGDKFQSKQLETIKFEKINGQKSLKYKANLLNRKPNEFGV